MSHSNSEGEGHAARRGTTRHAARHGGGLLVLPPPSYRRHLVSRPHTASPRLASPARTHARTNETNTISRLDSPPNLRYISMRCAPTPPQCPLPSILIAVCVPMSSYCDFYGMCAQHLVAFVGGNYVIFFTKARCECLLPLPYGPPNPCQILRKLVPNRRGGTPQEGPERSKTAQGPKSTPRDPLRRPKSVSNRLWERS